MPMYNLKSLIFITVIIIDGKCLEIYLTYTITKLWLYINVINVKQQYI